MLLPPTNCPSLYVVLILLHSSFWEYTSDGIYVPPMLATLSELAGMMLAAVATVTPCLQTFGMDSKADL